MLVIKKEAEEEEDTRKERGFKMTNKYTVQMKEHNDRLQP